MWQGEGDADAIIEARGLKQVSDSGALEAMVDEVIAANPDRWPSTAPPNRRSARSSPASSSARS
jgi:Asp-tRNA(Asn)/Glu-tRNA(Gln) amidotransferase B subunit